MPSGEIDACLLCAFFMIQDNNCRKSIIKILYSNSSDQECWEKLDKIKLKINWEIIQSIYFIDQKYTPEHLPYKRKKFSVLEWLAKFGLIVIGKNFKVSFTERGKRMINWIGLFLTPNKRGKYQGMKNLLEHIKNNKRTSDFWLDEHNANFSTAIHRNYSINRERFKEKKQNFLTSIHPFNNSSKSNLGVLRNLLSILFLWDEKSLDIQYRLQHFQDRCRFDLIGHFFLRYTDRYENHQPADASRGWIIFPVLRDPSLKEPDDQTLENGRIVGFFLGAIKDSDNNGDGYFEKLEYTTSAHDFFDLISDIKTVIMILSRIENREIYYNDIKREIENMRIDNDNERMFAHANKYLFGSLAFDARRIKEEISSINFFSKGSLQNLIEEYYLKCNLITDNYNRREALNKGKKNFLNFSTKPVKAATFFKYLFIVNHYSSEKGSFKLNFNRKELDFLENILLLKDFEKLPQSSGQINTIFYKIFNSKGIDLEISPKNLIINLPVDNDEMHAHFYFNFLALVNNFFAYWVKEVKADEAYKLHFIYLSEQQKCYLFQSKTGSTYSDIYNYDTFRGDISKYISSRNDPFKWEKLTEIGIGIRHVKTFFKQVFNSNFSIYRHKQKEVKSHEGEVHTIYNDIIYQCIDNIKPKLLTLDHEKIQYSDT